MKVVENICTLKINNMVIKESIKDRIVNSFLYLGTFTRSFIGKREISNSKITSKMDLIFEDDFRYFNDKSWRVGQAWGEFHPANTYQYYGKDSVFVKNDCLILNQIYSPKKLSNWESDKVYDIPFSVGLITSYDSYEYGFYEFEVELPNGFGLWPAVWLSCVDSWPPEIDILEAYSNEKSKYGLKLQTNFHYGVKDTAAGARNTPIHKQLDRLKLGCYWTKDFIKIYYNGHLVRQITSDSILKWFRDKKMTVILNNGIRPEYIKGMESQVSEFKIHSVKIWK
jgi:beta-glucanase (GH16 family)